MKKLYPKYEIISEIGSGMNNNRKGYKKIIDYAIKGEIKEIIITYKDRLSRFGYELIEYLVNKYSNGKIIILNQAKQTREEKLVEDVLSIMNVYVAKINGYRSHHHKRIN